MLIAMMAALTLTSCGSSPWDEMSSSVANFVDTYFNEGEVESVTDSGTSVIVTIKNGAQLTFNSENEWTDINGRGGTLPAMLITDQLPDKVVDYLKEMELVGSVYRITRSWHLLRVDLVDSYFTYDDQTGAITYPEMKPTDR